MLNMQEKNEISCDFNMKVAIASSTKEKPTTIFKL